METTINEHFTILSRPEDFAYLMILKEDMASNLLVKPSGSRSHGVQRSRVSKRLRHRSPRSDEMMKLSAAVARGKAIRKLIHKRVKKEFKCQGQHNVDGFRKYILKKNMREKLQSKVVSVWVSQRHSFYKIKIVNKLAYVQNLTNNTFAGDQVGSQKKVMTSKKEIGHMINAILTTRNSREMLTKQITLIEDFIQKYLDQIASLYGSDGIGNLRKDGANNIVDISIMEQEIPILREKIEILRALIFAKLRN